MGGERGTLEAVGEGDRPHSPAPTGEGEVARCPAALAIHPLAPSGHGWNSHCLADPPQTQSTAAHGLLYLQPPGAGCLWPCTPEASQACLASHIQG